MAITLLNKAACNAYQLAQFAKKSPFMMTTALNVEMALSSTKRGPTVFLVSKISCIAQMMIIMVIMDGPTRALTGLKMAKFLLMKAMLLNNAIIALLMSKTVLHQKMKKSVVIRWQHQIMIQKYLIKISWKPFSIH